jgi:hypothetical protein
MNVTNVTNFMKNYLTIASSIVAVLFIAAGAFLAPGGMVDATSYAHNSGSSHTAIECNLWADLDEVVTGGSVTLYWDTSGIDTLTINGETVSGESGSKTYNNIREDASFKLIGTNGDSVRCQEEVRVACLPTPEPEPEPEPEPTPEVCEAANVSAKLLSNDADTFTVRFTNDNDCDYPVGATSYTVPVDDEGDLCIWQNGKLDCQERFDFNDVTVPAHDTVEVTAAKPNQCYQIDWYYGTSVEVLDYDKFGDPLYSYVIDTYTGEDRLFGAKIDASLEECSVPPSVPSCDFLTATPGGTVTPGTEITLTWETTDAHTVYINNGINEVAVDGSTTYTISSDTIFVLTAVGDTAPDANCEVSVSVTEEDDAPICQSFSASPNSLPVGGGDVTLDWEVLDATNVSIAPTVGTVDLVGTTSVSVTESTTYTLTATDADGDTVSCQAPVAVADPEPDPFSCADNVSFTASDNSIDEGDDTTLSWTVTGADSVSISKIGATSFSGSETVSPSSDTTYTLTASKGSENISCPLTITVDEDNGGGGGGGGSVSPRCDLEISDDKIKEGETVEIKWDTRNATEVTLYDDKGEIIFTTDEYLSSDKKKYYDYSIKVKPARDTEYTLLAERGSRDRECTVDVKVEEDEETIVVLETREQEPLVAGISLSSVPYTGFEAGPFLTIIFYGLLILWAFYITYLIVVRNRSLSPEANGVSLYTPDAEKREIMQQAERIRPDVFTASTVTPMQGAHKANVPGVPNNLPVGTVATVVTESTSETEVVPATPAPVSVTNGESDDAVMTEIEDRAHQQRALLSSDAVHYFMSAFVDAGERNSKLDMVIAEAKKTYPLEDGWIVINEMRMQSICRECQVVEPASNHAPFKPTTVPEGAGSLAEAIVTGNVVAAYEMIGKRPMIALADAAADLDALFRMRQGAEAQASALLQQETATVSDEQIREAIEALTSALDGTYTDEAAAVKMAIMKAVKVFA